MSLHTLASTGWFFFPTLAILVGVVQIQFAAVLWIADQFPANWRGRAGFRVFLTNRYWALF